MIEIIKKTIKEYHQYLLDDKQRSLDNYIKYLDTACEIATIYKIQVIEIVRNSNKVKKQESACNEFTRLV